MSEQEEDFAALFEASTRTARIEQGQTIEGTVVAMGSDVAFINVGGKGEAVIALDELTNDEGVIEVAVGDRVQAVVTSTTGGLTLSRKLARGAASARQLEDAFRAGLPVEGKVAGVVKGGYEIRIGGARAFCPMSQIDTMRTADPAVHEGQVYTFRIAEYKESGRNIIVSRRALLEDEQRAGAADVWKTIVPGAVLTGRVTSVREFGAFVDLGAGVQGLLHVSEMGWARIADTSSVVAPGESITVKVLKVDEGTQKISLGLKQLMADPWSTVSSTYSVGQVRSGRITRLADFGAFVELEPGVEGLAHASTFAPTGRPDGWRKSAAVGTAADVEILNIDLEKKRIGVALVEAGTARGADPAVPPRSRTLDLVPGARVTGKVDRCEHFGVFVFLGPGRTGVIPISETGVANESDVRKAFPIGSDVEVVVLEIDAAGRRIRLSKKAVAHAQEAEEVRDYTQRQEKTTSGGAFGGSLADKLRGALKTK